MSRKFTNRELLGFGALGIVAISGFVYTLRGDIERLLRLSEPDNIVLVADKDTGTAKETKPKQAITEVTGSNLADIIKKSEKIPVFMKIYAPSCPPCRAMAPAYEEVAGSYYPGEVLFTQYKRTYNLEGQAPELPIIKEWGIAGAPNVVLVYTGEVKKMLGGGELIPLWGADGAAVFKGMVEEMLKTYCGDCGYLKKEKIE